jgi:hypothetical protein
MKWQNQAELAYSNDDNSKRSKAIAAGKAIDNALELEYGKGGGTKSHFMTDNWLKYFSYEALGPERIKLLWGLSPSPTQTDKQ